MWISISTILVVNDKYLRIIADSVSADSNNHPVLSVVDDYDYVDYSGRTMSAMTATMIGMFACLLSVVMYFVDPSAPAPLSLPLCSQLLDFCPSALNNTLDSDDVVCGGEWDMLSVALATQCINYTGWNCDRKKLTSVHQHAAGLR